MAKEKDPARTTPPPQFPDTPPPYTQSSDYSFLEIVMAMQGTLGKLTEAVETLKTQSKEHDQKIDRVTHSIYAAAAVVTVIGGIGLFILNKIWDAVLLYFKPH